MGKLYPHNQKVYDLALKYFEETQKVAIIQATGTGKGFLAGEFVREAFSGKKILILAPNNDICLNYEKNIGIQDGGNVLLRTYPSLLSVYKSDRDKFINIGKSIDVLILDEFHRLGAEKWGLATQELINIVEGHGGYILGLTATPVRYNDNSIFNNPYIPEEERKLLRRARNMSDEIFGGNVIQGVTLEEAVYLGILPSFKYILGSYGYESTLKDGYEKLEQLIELHGANNSEVRKIKKNLDDIVEKFGDEKDNLRKLIKTETQNLGTYQKWIVFCRTTEELLEVEDKLSYWFDKPLNKFTKKDTFKIKEDCLNLYTVNSSENNQNNEDNLSSFYDATSGLNIITCINKLNEGAHVPNVTGIIMLRSTLSPIVYLQQIGRALSAGNKNYPIIFDFMGNIENMEKVNRGEDEYVNSIVNSSSRVKDFISGAMEPRFKDSMLGGYSKKREPKIVIKANNIMTLSRLFGEIQDILHSSTSLMWTDIELSVLDKYYPRGGAEVVADILKQKSIGSRTIDAINKKAKERGLVFDIRKGDVIINDDNTLKWSVAEDEIILLGFESYAGRTQKDIAIILHRDRLRNRKPEQIINRYQHIKNGRGAVNTTYARNGSRWTDEDIYMLKVNYKLKLPLKIVANELERSPEAILSKAQELKLYRVNRNLNNKGEWTEEEEDYLFMYKDKLSKKELSDILERSVSSIEKKLIRLKNEKFYEKRLSQHHGYSNPRQWTELEERILSRKWDASWEKLCFLLSMKTPKQIKSKIESDCKKFSIKNPFKDDENYKNVV